MTIAIGGQKLGCLSVADMSCATSDALFEVIGVTAGAQHIFVVIALDDEVVGFGEVGHHLVGEGANISGEGHFVCSKFDEIARIVLTIMRYVECCEAEIFYEKRGSFLDDTFGCANGVFHQSMGADGLMHLCGGMDGYVVAVGKCADGLDMIHVIVGDEDGANLVEVVAMFLQAFANGANANAYIDENAVVAIAKEIAIAAAATAEAEECILIG